MAIASSLIAKTYSQPSSKIIKSYQIIWKTRLSGLKEKNSDWVSYVENNWKEKKREDLVHYFESLQRLIFSNIFFILSNINWRRNQASTSKWPASSRCLKEFHFCFSFCAKIFYIVFYFFIRFFERKKLRD